MSHKNFVIVIATTFAALILTASQALAIVVVGGQPDPTHNGNAMRLWLRGDSGIDNPGGLVGTWSDKSTHGNNAVSDDDVIKPTHSTTGFGGRQVLNFIDNGERMRLPAALNSVFAGDFTMFTLVAPNDGDPNRDELWFGLIDPAASTPNRTFQGTDGNSSPQTLNTMYKADGSNGNAIIDPSPIADGPSSAHTLFSYVNVAGGTNSVFVDGNSTAAATGGGVTNSNFTGITSGPCVGAACKDGSAWPNSGNTFKGEFAEIIIYDGALSDSDREAVEDYMLSYVPEPSSLVLLVLGICGLLVHRRRR